MSGYEHEHEHGHFMPHSHSHRHQGEQPTEAHERSGMGPHHHTHAALTRREPLDVEALLTALSVALHEALDPDCVGEPPYDKTEAMAEAVVRTPMVLAIAAEYARLEAADKP